MRSVAVLAIGLVLGCERQPPDPPVAPGPSVSAAFQFAADWPNYNRDLAGTRYSPLTQIDLTNVADLREAWSYPLGGRDPAAGSFGSELTPLVAAGVLYATAADRVVALRADSGKELWRFALERGVPSRSGLAFWPGSSTEPARVFFTAGRRLIALDAASGKRVPSFGMAGEIEMPAPYASGPTVFEELLIVGSNTAPGGVRAFDVLTGALRWDFDAAPAASGDEPSAEPSRGRRGQLHSAFAFTLDIDRALLYAVFEGDGVDYYLDGGLVDSPFSASIVALDARTGQRRWHFQAVHHDLWDFDIAAAPLLLDVTIEGARVPVLAAAAETGYLYLLDRVTGQPVFDIAETPTSSSSVPREQAAPTQPIPAKPPPLARVSFAADEIVTATDTTEVHAANCRDLRDRAGGVDNRGPFTPFGYRARGAPVHSTVVFPGAAGGSGWGGGAADPSLGRVFVNVSNEGALGYIEDNAADSTAAQTGDGARRDLLPYRRRSAAEEYSGRFVASATDPPSGAIEAPDAELVWPCQKPPWGTLAAVDVATGELAWQVPLGITEQLPEDRQRTGRPNVGGPIATASGLVFIGASNDRRFRAFDARSGEELWLVELPMSAHAVPITYLGADGKQYVAVAAAGVTLTDAPSDAGEAALIAYSLP